MDIEDKLDDTSVADEEDQQQLEDNSNEIKENNHKEQLNNMKLNNSSTKNDNNQSSTNSNFVENSNNNNTGNGGLIDAAEDCEMRNSDNEPESSSLTTPLSSSDLEQTPRSSSEVEGGDGEKSEKNESITNNISQSSVNNGQSHSFCNTSNISKRSVTLQMLLAAGILKPGDGTMTLEYHGQKFMGDLLESGIIRSQETSQEFSSPSAWATACKQIINPEKHSRKSGCGWASIKHRNLKLDYYKTVWFKRLREGSIDLKHITNGTSSSSSDTEDDDSQYCVLKFGEHFDKSPSFLSAQQMGAKILISCSEFKAVDRLQPFHVKITVEALALADLHCNLLNTECIGYISGHWNNEQNCLTMEVAHPSRILMPHSNSLECDMDRNRIALDIQKLGHDVVGWYHSHPKSPPHPTKDDISRQLDYQVMMKGASESSYIPCVGVIISPICYTSQEGSKKSQTQLFWVLPPPENRPMEMGRPMKIEYEIYNETNFSPTKMLLSMCALLNFYKLQKSQIDLNDLSGGKFEKLRETLSTLIVELKTNEAFWKEARELFLAPVSVPSPKLNSPANQNGDSESITNQAVSSPIVLNHASPAEATGEVEPISAASSPEEANGTRNSISPNPLSQMDASVTSVNSVKSTEEQNHESQLSPSSNHEPMEMEDVSD